jgi:hypothetical protein
VTLATHLLIIRDAIIAFGVPIFVIALLCLLEHDGQGGDDH